MNILDSFKEWANNLASANDFGQFFIFALVGASMTVVDLIQFQVFSRVLNRFFPGEQNRPRNNAISNIISFILATIYSYYLNLWLAFSDSGESGNSALIPYLLVSMVALAVSTGVVYELSKKNYYELYCKLPKWLVISHNRHWYEIIVKCFSLFFSMMINFWGYKWFVF